ncbi:MAG TPA: glycosyltransferase [Mycobacteriales bacterium]|jgi:glycosyltransferase involved in cell wall biosynthesis|nr:glycosyltransferase [Mycobacteriales bacterium]
MTDTAARVAVLVPCRDEAATVAQVVFDFQHALPGAVVYVYDNASADDTGARAKAAGAVVRREMRPGKGTVVRRMFADIDADIYVLVDGDGTYDADAAPGMIRMLVEDQLDMVVGVRRESEEDAYRNGHRLGNAFFSRLLRMLFGGVFADVFSGYRVMSRRLVKSFPVASGGFEIETELTAHALDVRAACAEMPTVYRSRPEGSESKLRTWRDGWRIMMAAVVFYKELRPFRFFGLVAMLLTALAIALGVPVIAEFVRTGLVPQMPTAILAAAIQVAAVVAGTSGVVLDSIGRGRRETKLLTYLSLPSAADLVVPGVSERPANLKVAGGSGGS